MIDVGIVGGTGYTGIELIRLLLQHPRVRLKVLTSRSEAGLDVAEMFPSLRGILDLKFSPLELAPLLACDVVFFATPHGVAMQYAQALTEAGVKLIDLAADFRLQDLQQFEHWYGMAHQCPALLKQAVYGLSELNREQIKTAQIVANPGCYPTTVQLGLAPLLKSAHDLIDYKNIIVDAKSGVSGAGRKASLGLNFAECADNFKAYAVSGHRHHPEIVERLEAISGKQHQFNQLTFVPHLVPMIRGMLSTIYVNLTQVGQAANLQTLYQDFYQYERFVDVMPANSYPETRSVRGANYLRIALHQPSAERLIILVSQDNLVKGAAGQAIQNMNIMFAMDEHLGLNNIGLLP